MYPTSRKRYSRYHRRKCDHGLASFKPSTQPFIRPSNKDSWLKRFVGRGSHCWNRPATRVRLCTHRRVLSGDQLSAEFHTKSGVLTCRSSANVARFRTTSLGSQSIKVQPSSSFSCSERCSRQTRGAIAESTLSRARGDVDEICKIEVLTRRSKPCHTRRVHHGGRQSLCI